MRLDIEDEVFVSGDPIATSSLIVLTLEGRHDWHPTPETALLAERFAAKQAPMLSEYLQKVLEESANPATPPATVVRVRVEELLAVLADLRRPAVLLVENEIGDGGFVRAVAAALGDDRIVEALEDHNGWLMLKHGGGTGQMPVFAARLRRAFNRVVRVAVLFDSDRSGPGDKGNNQEKVAKCLAAGVPEVHLLNWRMMENYVPFSVWRHHFPGRSGQIDRLRQMIPRQRGYHNLKDEFGGKDKMPKQMFPEGLHLTEADFDELGPGVVTELRELLARLHRIL